MRERRNRGRSEYGSEKRRELIKKKSDERRVRNIDKKRKSKRRTNSLMKSLEYDTGIVPTEKDFLRDLQEEKDKGTLGKDSKRKLDDSINKFRDLDKDFRKDMQDIYQDYHSNESDKQKDLIDRKNKFLTDVGELEEKEKDKIKPKKSDKDDIEENSSAGGKAVALAKGVAKTTYKVTKFAVKKTAKFLISKSPHALALKLIILFGIFLAFVSTSIFGLTLLFGAFSVLTDGGDDGKTTAKKEDKKEKEDDKIDGDYTQGKKIKLSDSERSYTEKLVEAEATGQSIKGKWAVASVIANRVDSSQFPNDVISVINAPKQFSPVGTDVWKGADGRMHKVKVTKTSKTAVKRAFDDGKRSVPKNVLFFYAKGVDAWAGREYKKYGEIEGHIFTTNEKK